MAFIEAYAEPDDQPDGGEGVSPVEWVARAPNAVNLIDALDDAQRIELATLVKREYEIDCESMKPWREAMDKGLEMASALERDAKTWPWAGASNIKYPLVMTAALQFNARAYPAIVPAGDIVQCRTHGKDRGGMKKARAERVSAWTSYRLRAKMPEWEPDTDRLTVLLPIVGTMVRKVWWSAAKGRECSRLVRPGDFVVNDSCAALENAPRMSEELRLYPHEVVERQNTGEFIEGDWFEADADDTSKPVEFVEQHRLYDADGDGYPEPYVVIFHKDSEQVVRVAANWRPEGVRVEGDRIVSIQRADYYEDYHFLPWSGFWSIGLGVLLRDISEAIDGTINRINDSATLSSLGGGFIGGEARLRGGPQRVKPGEWQQVSAMGNDLRSAFFPVPAKEPSPVLFNMLGLLIDAARELANVKDIAAEANRSNQPATTTLALIEQGMAVFTAVYKRIHRALRGEFKRLGGLYAEHAQELAAEYAAFHDELERPEGAENDPRIAQAEAQLIMADFNAADMDIEPVADPRAVTSPQKLGQAQLLMEMAGMGMVDPNAARDRMLDAAGIANAEDLTPEPTPEAAAQAQKAQAMQDMAADASVRKLMLENVKAGMEIAEMEAEISKRHAEAVKTMAEAEAADPLNPVNAAMMQLREMKVRLEADRARLERMARPAGNGGGSGGAAQGGGRPQAPAAASLLGPGGASPGGMGAGTGSGPMGL